jgi:hypothetical protein
MIAPYGDAPESVDSNRKNSGRIFDGSRTSDCCAAANMTAARWRGSQGRAGRRARSIADGGIGEERCRFRKSCLRGGPPMGSSGACRTIGGRDHPPGQPAHRADRDDRVVTWNLGRDLGCYCLALPGLSGSGDRPSRFDRRGWAVSIGRRWRSDLCGSARC